MVRYGQKTLSGPTPLKKRATGRNSRIHPPLSGLQSRLGDNSGLITWDLSILSPKTGLQFQKGLTIKQGVSDTYLRRAGDVEVQVLQRPGHRFSRPGPARAQRGNVVWMETVHVLGRRDRLQHVLLVDLQEQSRGKASPSNTYGGGDTERGKK